MFSQCRVNRYTQESREFYPVFSRIMTFSKFEVGICFPSAWYIDIHKKLANFTPFFQG